MGTENTHWGSWTTHGGRRLHAGANRRGEPGGAMQDGADTFALSLTGGTFRHSKVPVVCHTWTPGGAEAVPGKHPRTYHGHWESGGCWMRRGLCAHRRPQVLPTSGCRGLNHPGLPALTPGDVMRTRKRPAPSGLLGGVVWVCSFFSSLRQQASLSGLRSRKCSSRGAGLLDCSVDESLSNWEAYIWEGGSSRNYPAFHPPLPSLNPSPRSCQTSGSTWALRRG